MFWQRKKRDLQEEVRKLKERLAGRTHEQYIHNEWIESIRRRILVTLKRWGGTLRVCELDLHIADHEYDEGCDAFCFVKHDDFMEALRGLVTQRLVTEAAAAEIMGETVWEYLNEVTLVQAKKRRFWFLAAA